jgi:abnormal spindle-like microcephaly-associated protein
VRLARLVECVAAPSLSRRMLDDGSPRRRTSADSLRSPARKDEPFVTAHLRHPATSRAAMVGNNEVALRALRAGGGAAARLAASVTPADLVDGHREKTVALLWGLVAECGIASVLDWDEVEREIARLRGDEREAEERGVEECRELLWRWARAVAAKAGVQGEGEEMLEAAVDEYALLIPGAEVGSGEGLAAKMRAIGFGPTFGKSHAFLPLSRRLTRRVVALFSSGQDTATLLFLASRLLSGSRAERHRRATLKMLATECATVVRTRARIESAAVALQRAWRAGAEARKTSKALAEEQRALDEARRREDERLEVDFWMV